MGHLSNRQPERTANKGLESRLAKYAVAGGAMLGAPFAAHADIIYSGIINQTVSGTGGSYTVPVLSNFTLTTNDTTVGGYYGNSVSVTGAKGFVPAFNNTNPAALDFGNVISIANATGPGSLAAVPLLRYGTFPTPPSGFPALGYKGGNWPQDGSNAYLGMQYTCSTPSSLACTAWAQINVSVSGSQGAETATLVDYAYDTTPGESIYAGGSATPEPSSLALFAVGGAAALALLRRRRKSALVA